jgi:hypothetical protein
MYKADDTSLLTESLYIMIRNENEITSPTMHHSFRPPSESALTCPISNPKSIKIACYSINFM